jgi:hypothetical protein
LGLFALEAVVPRGHQSHGREAQGKSQENTANENSDDHGLTSFSFRKIIMFAVNGLENQSGATGPPQHFFFPARVRPGGFIPLLAHGENDLNFGDHSSSSSSLFTGSPPNPGKVRRR